MAEAPPSGRAGRSVSKTPAPAVGLSPVRSRRGGSRKVTAESAGVEALMLDVATEASQSFPREQMRRALARMGTGLTYGINYDYSVLTMGSTRRYFDRSWDIFADSALHPSF